MHGRVGGMHGGGGLVWQGGMHGGGMRGRGTTTPADGTHATRMHSCSS